MDSNCSMFPISMGMLPVNLFPDRFKDLNSTKVVSSTALSPYDFTSSRLISLTRAVLVCSTIEVRLLIHFGIVPMKLLLARYFSTKHAIIRDVKVRQRSQVGNGIQNGALKLVATKIKMTQLSAFINPTWYTGTEIIFRKIKISQPFHSPYASRNCP
nr:hypothetical protein Iba_chr12fCG21170 [Ipomoea batatas]